MFWIFRWIMGALALLVVSAIVPGVKIRGFGGALLAALLLGLFNAFIGPLLLLISLPINILTLGLFTLVINALLFWMAGSVFPGFEVSGFGSAFLGALVLSVLSVVFWLLII